MGLFSLRALLGALLALALLAGPAAGRPVAADPAPPPAADGTRIAAAFAKLSRTTSWQLVAKVPLKFDAHNPEGVAVAGVVFVDAMGRDATRRQLAIWPRSQAPAQRREWAKPVQDGVDVERGEALAGSIRTLGDIPVVVITGARTWTASGGDAPPRWLQALDRLWRRLHVELARLSSDHVHVVGLRSEHLVMDSDQQPWIMSAPRRP